MKDKTKNDSEEAKLGALKELEEENGDGKVGDGEKEENAGLGTVIPLEQKKKAEVQEEGKEFIKSHGYVPVNLESAPSMGMFYLKDARFKIRGADVPEIKNWSLLDESDILNVEDHIVDILKACMKIEYPSHGKIGSYSDIKEIDRYYFLFLIREHTMRAKDRERRLYQLSTCPICGKKDKAEIDASRFSRFSIPSWIKKFYDEDDRCFSIKIPEFNVDFKVYIPSIGVDHATKNYITKKERQKQISNNGYYDINFLTKFVPYLVPDSSYINDAQLDKLREIYDNWNEETLTCCVKIIEELNKDTIPQIEFRCDKAEAKANEEGGQAYCYRTPVRFRKGYRSIFDFSGVLDKLFADPE